MIFALEDDCEGGGGSSGRGGGDSDISIMIETEVL